MREELSIRFQREGEKASRDSRERERKLSRDSRERESELVCVGGEKRRRSKYSFGRCQCHWGVVQVIDWTDPKLGVVWCCCLCFLGAEVPFLGSGDPYSGVQTGL